MTRPHTFLHQLESALDEAIAADDPAGVARVHLQLARLYASSGGPVDKARRALAVAERFAQRTPYVHLLREIRLQRTLLERHPDRLDEWAEEVTMPLPEPVMAAPAPVEPTVGRYAVEDQDPVQSHTDLLALLVAAGALLATPAGVAAVAVWNLT